ncbi:hypothetical protein C1Y40_00368 [Mycobacterium talmoniae]|uniref:Uncharacterized protein n=1 Tax=Mycobacterium talmoniae TaxID=1858794 RepID=A0A2S8BRV9_9MYCO|nr:hypothetical protein C1Y40_00368 [Mycobacterium talmoniae]
MLPWLTTVLIWVCLPLNASYSGTAYPVGYLVMTLSEPSVSLVELFNFNRSCCSRSSICALSTLPASICASATEVSTGLYPRVSSLI